MAGLDNEHCCRVEFCGEGGAQECSRARTTGTAGGKGIKRGQGEKDIEVVRTRSDDVVEKWWVWKGAERERRSAVR